MITKIEGNMIVVTASSKPAGTYLLGDFSDEELKEEKALLTAQLFASSVEDTQHIYDLISVINGELDKRLLEKLGDKNKYLNLAAELARSEKNE